MAAADVTPGDVRNMNNKELRALAISLGVATRENTKSSEALRLACVPALLQAPQRQHSRASASEPGAASSGPAARAVPREPGSGPLTPSSSQAQVQADDALMRKVISLELGNAELKCKVIKLEKSRDHFKSRVLHLGREAKKLKRTVKHLMWPFIRTLNAPDAPKVVKDLANKGRLSSSAKQDGR